MARGWAIGGIGDGTREAALAAAEEAGMPIGAWVEQALRRALETGTGPSAPEGAGLGEVEALVRRVVAEELRPVREALDRLEVRAMVPDPAGGGPVTLMRERLRRHRAR